MLIFLLCQMMEYHANYLCCRSIDCLVGGTHVVGNFWKEPVNIEIYLGIFLSQFWDQMLILWPPYQSRNEISNNVLCATCKASDQPAHMRSLIRASASRLNILWELATDWTSFSVSKLKRRLHRLVWVYPCQNATLLEITCRGSIMMISEKHESKIQYLI